MGVMMKLESMPWSAWDLTSMAMATARLAKVKLFSPTASQKQGPRSTSTPTARPRPRITSTPSKARATPARTSPRT